MLHTTELESNISAVLQVCPPPVGTLKTEIHWCESEGQMNSTHVVEGVLELQRLREQRFALVGGTVVYGGLQKSDPSQDVLFARPLCRVRVIADEI